MENPTPLELELPYYDLEYELEARALFEWQKIERRIAGAKLKGHYAISIKWDIECPYEVAGYIEFYETEQKYQFKSRRSWVSIKWFHEKKKEIPKRPNRVPKKINSR